MDYEETALCPENNNEYFKFYLVVDVSLLTTQKGLESVNKCVSNLNALHCI